jgi:hypothetical protein
MFVDDVRYFTWVNEGTGRSSWPYDHAYNLILDLAAGGDWGSVGAPIDDRPSRSGCSSITCGLIN